LRQGCREGLFSGRCSWLGEYVLPAFAPFIPVLGLQHVILDAEFPEPAVQMESEGARFITGHDFVREPLLFDHEQK